MQRVTVSMALIIVSGGTVFAADVPSEMAASSPGSYKIQEQPLARYHDQVLSPVARFGKDGWHLAYLTIMGGKGVVVVDGKGGPGYDWIAEQSPILSPDAKRVAYVAQKGAKWLVVVDGKAGPEYDGIKICWSYPIFLG